MCKPTNVHERMQMVLWRARRHPIAPKSAMQFGNTLNTRMGPGVGLHQQTFLYKPLCCPASPVVWASEIASASWADALQEALIIVVQCDQWAILRLSVVSLIAGTA